MSEVSATAGFRENPESSVDRVLDAFVEELLELKIRGVPDDEARVRALVYARSVGSILKPPVEILGVSVG